MSISYSKLFINEKNEPTEDFLELLNLFHIKHNGSLEDIVIQTQKEWLRTENKERAEIDEIQISKDKKDQAFKLFEKLGCINKIDPSKKEYYYALLLGDDTIGMKLRISYLLNLWNQGIRFNKLIFLVGQRPRDNKEEDLSALTEKYNEKLPIKKYWKLEKMPETETEIAKIIWQSLELPKDFESVKVTFIDTPMQKKSDGLLRRPNTADTINEWLNKEKPEPVSCLIISINPFIAYQDSVAKTSIPNSFEIETVGHEALNDEKISIYLDTIARILYQEQIRLNKKKKRYNF